MKWVVAAVLACAAPAFAENEEAAKLFEEGRTLGEQGRTDEACDRFERSYGIEQAPGTALNLAECEERAGNWSRAYDLYTGAEKVFDIEGKATRAKFARERAAAVRRMHPEVVKEPEPVVEQPEEVPTTPTRSPTSTKRTVAKVAAAGFLGITAIGVVAWIYSYRELQEFGDAEISSIMGEPRTPGAVDQEDCGRVTLSPDDAQSKFVAACDANARLRWLQPLTLLTAGLGAGAIIYLVVTKPSSQNIAVVPSSNGAYVTATFAF